jgi:hypothetical protein
VLRSLELILEHMRGVKEIRSQRELGLLEEIIELVGRWQRDLLRSHSAPLPKAVASCALCGQELLVDPSTYHPRCSRCDGRLFSIVPTRFEEARALAAG